MVHDLSKTKINDLTVEGARAELKRLAELLLTANRQYHAEDAPELSDAEYDREKQRNQAIEARFPELVRPDSPSFQVGAAPSSGFSKIKHEKRMMSLGNAFSVEDVQEFDARVRSFLGLNSDQALAYTAEPKIDGLSLSVRYENGDLVAAATRGDGAIGEDVTENAKTIKDIPHRIENAPEILEVRGEVYMSHTDFQNLNARQLELGDKPFSNPRNAAAGYAASRSASAGYAAAGYGSRTQCFALC